MINGEVMNRCVGAVETSESSFTAPCQAAGAPEGGHFMPSHGPLTEGQLMKPDDRDSRERGRDGGDFTEGAVL